MIGLEQALAAEIDYLKQQHRNNNYTLTKGKLISISKDTGISAIRGYYRFENTQLLNLRSEDMCTCTITGSDYTAIIELCDRYCIEISIEGFTDDSIDSMVLSVQSWKLLEVQLNKLKNIKHNRILSSIEREHVNPGQNFKEFEYGQDAAFNRAISTPITAIWGPPGTGKTYTLARIAIELMNQGKRVLIMSQSNMAVDSSVLQIRKVLNNLGVMPHNRILRYGMVHSDDLASEHAYVSWEAAFDSFPDYRKRYSELFEEMGKGRLEQDRIKEIKAERNSILSDVSKKESELISDARIIATTATKATLNDSISSQTWDAVIFDEVSMAYVSQIAIAASMAKEHLILIGDFRQLAPIVTSPGGAALKEDIFSYLHVTRPNGTVNKHPWLVMLNEQWRMHPDIAAFVNERIYEGKITTAPSTIAETEEIASSEPFPEKVFAYVDYSDFQGTCFSTSRGSRFNLFSAAISLILAIKAEVSGQDVGIITPYAAQSKLINALLADSEKLVGRRYHIYCSTVHQFQGSEKDVIVFDTVESYPKSAAGKILSAADGDDHDMRLINVALTRARGKFIIVGNNEFIRLQTDISDDMKALIRKSREVYHLSSSRLSEFLKTDGASSIFHIYDELSDAIKPFKYDIFQCKKPAVIQYWHSKNNFVSPSSPYSPREFLADLQAADAYKRIYSTAAGENTIGSVLGAAKIRRIADPPIDDFIIVDEKTIWWNIPKVTSKSIKGIRPVFRIAGRETAIQFSKLAELEDSINKAMNQQRQAAASRSDFYDFAKDRFKCGNPACHGGIPEFRISSKGMYYVICKTCKQPIINYIPKNIVEDYIAKYDIRCAHCGGRIKVSRQYWSVYCENDYGHKDIKFNDIITKPLSAFRHKMPNQVKSAPTASGKIPAKQPQPVSPKKPKLGGIRIIKKTNNGGS